MLDISYTAALEARRTIDETDRSIVMVAEIWNGSEKSIPKFFLATMIATFLGCFMWFSRAFGAS